MRITAFLIIVLIAKISFAQEIIMQGIVIDERTLPFSGA